MSGSSPLWLLLTVLVTVRAAPTTFLAFVQTGSYTVDTSPYYNNSANRRIDARYDIPLSPAINTTTYRAGLCLDSLNLQLFGDRLSLGLSVYDRTSSILVVNVSSYLGDYLQLLRIRYAVSHPDFHFINIHELISPSNLAAPLNSTHSYSLSLALPAYASADCDFLPFLTGFDATTSGPGSKFDLYPSLTSSDSSVTITVQSSLKETVTLAYVSYTVVVVNRVGMAGLIGGSMWRGSKSENKKPAVKVSNGSTLVYNNNSFFGVAAFHMDKDKALAFSSSLTADSLAVNEPAQYSFLLVSYIVFAAENCPPPNFIHSVDNSCLAVCPPAYLGNTSIYQCQPCAPNCADCLGSASNCSACPNTTFLLTGACQICSSSASLAHCLECSSSSVCIRCDSLTLLNATDQCYPDCSLIPNCSACIITTALLCNGCAAGYQVSAGVCVEACGDGSIVGAEECDDTNSADGDGCSSNCRVETYFVCTGSPSLCILSSLILTPITLLKDPAANSFTLSLRLSPASLPLYSTLNWKLAFLPTYQAISVEEVTYNPATNTLEVRSSYTASLVGQSVSYQFDPSRTGAGLMGSLPMVQLYGPSSTDNNLSLQHFTEEVYWLGTAMSWLAGAEGIAAFMLFLGGYLGAKLIALECVAVVQLSYISLVSLRNIAPPFHAMRHLRLSFGYTHALDYAYDTQLLPEFKGHNLGGGPLTDYNFLLVFVLAPIALAAVSKLLSVTLLKNRPILKNAWRRLLGEFLLYGLLFAAYVVFLSLGISVRCWTGEASNLVLGVLILALMVVLTVLSNRLPKYFGEFKKRFQILNICQYTYNFEAAERFLTAILVATLTTLSFQMVFVILIFGAKLAFVAIRRPYVPDGWRRQTANLCIALVILFLFLGCKLADQSSNFSLFAPFLILALLGICIGYSSILLVLQLRENVSFRESIDSGEEMSVQENQKLQYEMFEKQMLPKNESLISAINQSLGKMTAQQVKAEWVKYGNQNPLSHNKFYGEVKEHLVRKKLKNTQPDNIEPI